ncbi:MAG TPA: FAD-dependent oxidoreductase [Trebonia sp.]|nr:FAD-dependent oxidoreductase [Trebonia sp.]
MTDLIVVGAGLAGSAAAWAAARRGLDVVVLEAFEPGHPNGSSHGSARIFRRVYDDPLYVRMTGAARDRWRALEDEAGETLITVTGGIDFGPARGAEGLFEVVRSCDVMAEVVPAGEARERWPGFDFGTDPVLFHPEAGALDPDRAVAAMLRLAARCGAEIHFRAPATSIGAAGEGALVRTDRGEFTAPVAVLAVGAWLEPLAAHLVPLPDLRVTQEQILHLEQRTPPGPWPTFIYDDAATIFYGLLGGRDGGVPGAVKIGEHHVGRVTTAAGRDFTADPGRRQRILDFAARCLPGLDNSKMWGEATCLYTTTANQDFLLDRHGPFVLASACSGHGAKFAPLLGEIIAGLAAGEPSPDPRFTLAAHLAAHRADSD